MSNYPRIVHILDDLSMGGVTRALENFSHPALTEFGVHETKDIRTDEVCAKSPSDIAIIHFTANWQKVGQLLKLRKHSGFSQIILIEHSYTEGFEVSEVSSKMRFRSMLKCAYGLVDTVVAVSRTQREWMIRAGLAKPHKIIAIPQSRDCSSLLNVACLTPSAGPLKIGAFGRFHKQKGFDLLLKAMSYIPADIAELKLAGTGPEEETLQATADHLPHVEICDPFKSPDDFLGSVDLVAIPSRWEAFGLVGTEARMAGRPILAAHIDGLVDQLSEGAFSHVCGSISSIVAAIRLAAKATDLHERGAAARQQATSEYGRTISRWAHLLYMEMGLAAAAE